MTCKPLQMPMVQADFGSVGAAAANLPAQVRRLNRCSPQLQFSSRVLHMEARAWSEAEQ